MKQVLMFLLTATLVSFVQTRGQAQQELALNTVLKSGITGKEADIAGDDIARINTKAIVHFRKNFKKAWNVKWMVLSDGFQASFHQAHSVQRIFYYENGNLAGSVKVYEAAYLPHEIRETAKEIYPAFTVVYVSEIQMAHLNSSPTFILQMQGKNDFKVVRICDDMVDELKLQ